MGPKSKPKEKKKKAKRSEGSGEKVEESLTFKEAVLLCRLQSLQKQRGLIKTDIEKVRRQNGEQRLRNKILKQEQQIHVENAVTQAKLLEMQLNNQDKVTKEQVEDTFRQRLHYEQEQENEVLNIEKRILGLTDEVEITKSKVKELEDYKSKGKCLHETQIRLMLQEMEDLEKSYLELSESVSYKLLLTKENSQKMVMTNVTKQKELASERAMDRLSHKSQQEFMDNKWLLTEVRVHENQLQESRQIVAALEAANLEIISRLFNLQLGEVQTSNENDMLNMGDDISEVKYGLELVAIEENRIFQNEFHRALDNYPRDITEANEDTASDVNSLPPLHIKGYHIASQSISGEQINNVIDKRHSNWTLL